MFFLCSFIENAIGFNKMKTLPLITNYPMGGTRTHTKEEQNWGKSASLFFSEMIAKRRTITYLKYTAFS